MNETIILIREIIPSASSPEWITAISTTVLATLTFFTLLITIFIALYLEDHKKHKRRPVIDLFLRKDEPCVVYGNDKKDLKYFKVKVKNIGKTTARNCRLKLIVVYPWHNSKPIISDPVVLKWSSSPLDSRYLISQNQRLTCKSLDPMFKEGKDITPNKGWELCDLFCVAKGGKTINFISSMYENRHVFKEKEDYIFFVEVVADNMSPKTFAFKINNNSDWEKINVEKLRD